MFEDQPSVVLRDRFANKDWFHSVAFDKHRRIVVYVKYMCEETDNIPRELGGIRVLCHFASSKSINRELFSHRGVQAEKPSLEPKDLDLDLDEPDLRELIKELDRLEKMSGSNIMQDIFYEVHDGANAVTNLSTKFPDVRSGMEVLYQQYGFDLIYENMDG